MFCVIKGSGNPPKVRRVSKDERGMYEGGRIGTGVELGGREASSDKEMGNMCRTGHILSEGCCEVLRLSEAVARICAFG